MSVLIILKTGITYRLCAFGLQEKNVDNEIGKINLTVQKYNRKLLQSVLYPLFQAMTIYNKVSDHKAPVTKSTEKKPADKVDNKHFVEEQLEKLSDLHPDDILKEELDNIVSGKKES